MLNVYQTAHAKAFNVGVAIPAHSLLEYQSLIGRLLETGASFHEAEIALRPLCADLLKTPVESA